MFGLDKGYEMQPRLKWKSHRKKLDSFKVEETQMSRNQCISIESRRKLDFVKKHFLPKDVLD